MRARPIALALAAVGLVTAGCGGASDTKDATAAGSSAGSGNTVSLVAYSTPQVVYDELIPAFNAKQGAKGAKFKTSFGASGEQSRAVEAGSKADVVSFSVEPDMTRLQESRPRGALGQDLDLGRRLHRPQGQPEGHQGWDDLLRTASRS